jgi:hypothetical protein
MAENSLATAISGINWNENVASFLLDEAAVSMLAQTNTRLAIWARQFEAIDRGNPALTFLREMQSASHTVVVLTALALYKPAAASMRNMVEAALYYSYFRTHPSELATLASGAYYIEKGNIIDFHKRHTPQFNSLQEKLGLLSRLEKWYGSVSSIIHGQIPGTWLDHASIAGIKPKSSTQAIVVAKFSEGEDVVHRLFLCTVGRLLWDDFSTTAKKHLIKGLSGDIKTILQLDSA